MMKDGVAVHQMRILGFTNATHIPEEKALEWGTGVLQGLHAISVEELLEKAKACCEKKACIIEPNSWVSEVEFPYPIGGTGRSPLHQESREIREITRSPQDSSEFGMMISLRNVTNGSRILRILIILSCPSSAVKIASFTGFTTW
ncbi:unnamed protein product [Aspergillus oryzae]|nr:unnamed protein product [Aspergillus oryzae]